MKTGIKVKVETVSGVQKKAANNVLRLLWKVVAMQMGVVLESVGLSVLGIGGLKIV